MPEGDTIFRAARALHRALAGRVVTRFETVLPLLSRVDDDQPLAGRTIESVSSVGKHLLVRFSGDLVLRTHMRMNGSWHIYRPGERWRLPRQAMRVVIATAEFEAVAFNVPVAEFIRARDIDRHRDLRRLGPDLLADDFDAADALRRLRERPGSPIAEALLNQRILAGIGNVYKSEVLFACRTHPFVSVADLSDAQLSALINSARRFLRANVAESLPAMTTYPGYRRATRRAHRRADRSDRLWVYGRGGKPCRRCDTPIAARKTGDGARVTYWCPRCQPAPEQGCE
jgi:endonuclease-8